MPTVSISPTIFDENEDEFVITFTLDEPAGRFGAGFELSAIENGTATSRNDFAPFEGQRVEFAEGETEAVVTIDSRGSALNVGDTNFGILLEDPFGLTLPGRGQYATQTVVLLEGDSATEDRSIFVSDPVIEQRFEDKEAVFEIQISQPFSQSTTFEYTTLDIDAKAGVDYTAKTGTITFVPGQTVAFVSVTITGDNAFTGTQRAFSLAIDADTEFGATTLDNIGTATIVDDETFFGPQVIGTSGNDILHGSNLADSIFGGDGDDIIRAYGSVAFDFIDPGAGDDTVFGGRGRDLVSYENSTNDIVANLANNIAIGEGTDRLFSIEAINTGSGNDRIFGDNQSNDIDAGEGDNLIAGLGGDDQLRGGTGDDAISGGDGEDEIFGDAGSNRLFGNAGNDFIVSNGEDIVNGGDGDDQIFTRGANIAIVGGAGNDTMSAFGDNVDAMNGGDGNDNMFLDGGNDRAFGGNGDDGILGGTGDDILGGLAGDDQLFGNEGDDGLSGGTGEDTLTGGAGNDRLFGGNDNDTLEGGEDDDLLVGQFGVDTYVFSGDIGNDTIVRYGEVDSGARVDEVIDMTAYGIGFSDLFVVQDGTSTVITSDDFEGSITLTFVSAGTITEDDFLF